MKGTPKKGSTDIDVSAAVTSANKLTEKTVRETVDKSKVPMRTIAVRINEVDYNRLNSLFTAQGTNISQAGRAAIFRLADQIETGILEIPNGVIRERRRS
jgi:hypothetical protein